MSVRRNVSNWAFWSVWTFVQQRHGAQLAEGSCGMRWASGLVRLEQVSRPCLWTRPSSAGLSPAPCWRGFSGLGRSWHPSWLELLGASYLVPTSISSSTISSTCQLLGGLHKCHACSCSVTILQGILGKKISKIKRKSL